MLYEQLKSLAYDLGIPKITKEDYSYITDNLKYPLYEWQKNALENFLLNEKIRKAQCKNGTTLPPNHLMFNMATGSGKTLLMAALILYYYRQGYRHFIFFVNQNAILGKTQANFIDSNHNKYLFKENIVIDKQTACLREVEQFSEVCDDIQIKFTTIQKLHNDIYKENENSLLLSDLQKRDLILFGDEAHHLNAASKKKDEYELSDDISFMQELKDSAKEEDIERSWEKTVCHLILQKGGRTEYNNKNCLLEFTATIPHSEEVQKKYEDKIIIKFELKDFVEAGCTKHIRLVRSNLEKRERILQALLLNWYRYSVAVKYGISNFKPVILFRSKEIEESKKEYMDFLELCKNVKADDFDFINRLAKVKAENELFSNESYMLDGRIFEKINLYLKENNLSFETATDYIHENFQGRNVIITNSKTNKTKKEKTDSETDRLLNSLEDDSNHIRAIFTVQRLTEGWDVLNLYDIVRLYSGRDTNFKTKKAGTSTTSEVQLIGRGVRYFPFAYKDKQSNRRKFDNDLTNELRILEEFYFHSGEDHRYISELSTELKNRGFIQEKRTQKIYNVKKEKQKKLSEMYLFVNECKENPNRKLKSFPKDIPPFEYTICIGIYSEIQNVNFTKKEDERFVAESNLRKTTLLSVRDIPRHIKFKAIHILNTNSASYFSFENLRKRFEIQSVEDFFHFIDEVKINLVTDADFDNIPNKKILSLCIDFLLYIQSQLDTYDKPFIGTDFHLVKFSDVFSFDEKKGKICFKKEKLIFIDDEKTDARENNELETSLKNTDWYLLDSFWGTSEERKLIEFIKDNEKNLLERYNSFDLLRNEEVYKIHDFDTGRGFLPDFILFLEGKQNAQNALYQVFIEPKGKHLTGNDNDSWKNIFLKKITERYGVRNIITNECLSYVLIGLPFFNSEDKNLKETFLNEFNTLL